jgi:very-short-patch-repair endonuclease
LAKSLRGRSTEAEKQLWALLRDRRFAGYKFRRQVPIGPYIADFACLDARLIVELDGGQHADSQRDVVRDQWLVDDGYRVLRFWNVELATNRDGVLEAVWVALQEPRP